jgi:hypothetical protein
MYSARILVDRDRLQEGEGMVFSSPFQAIIDHTAAQMPIWDPKSEPYLVAAADCLFQVECTADLTNWQAYSLSAGKRSELTFLVGLCEPELGGPRMKVAQALRFVSSRAGDGSPLLNEVQVESFGDYGATQADSVSGLVTQNMFSARLRFVRENMTFRAMLVDEYGNLTEIGSFTHQKRGLLPFFMAVNGGDDLGAPQVQFDLSNPVWNQSYAWLPDEEIPPLNVAYSGSQPGGGAGMVITWDAPSWAILEDGLESKYHLEVVSTPGGFSGNPQSYLTNYNGSPSASYFDFSAGETRWVKIRARRDFTYGPWTEPIPLTQMSQNVGLDIVGDQSTFSFGPIDDGNGNVAVSYALAYSETPFSNPNTDPGVTIIGGLSYPVQYALPYGVHYATVWANMTAPGYGWESGFGNLLVVDSPEVAVTNLNVFQVYPGSSALIQVDFLPNQHTGWDLYVGYDNPNVSSQSYDVSYSVAPGSQYIDNLPLGTPLYFVVSGTGSTLDSAVFGPLTLT